MLEKYGFIVKANNYRHTKDSARLDTEGFSTQVVCVSSDEEAIFAAKTMINQGIQVIELCGGFGQESAEFVIAQLDTQVPIGYVTFNSKEQQKLTRLIPNSD